jgi:hypothetical protein
MAEPKQIDIVRRPYALWQQAGEPQGKDEEFYLRAEQELSGNAGNGADTEERKE